MNYNWDARFGRMAKLVSFWSKDPSTRVGAVIVRPDKTIASLGYNGLPKGVPDSADWLNDREIKYKVVKHAEENAILHANQPVEGCTIYTYPLPPCSSCAGDIIQRGIKRVVSFVPADKQDYLESRKDCFGFDLTRLMFSYAGVTFELVLGDPCLFDDEEAAAGDNVVCLK